MTPLYQVYLLHFDQPVGRAQHYMGICKSARLHWRMLEHQRGVGARLTSDAAAQGIGFKIARTWLCDDPAKERELKNAKGFKKICPICSPESWPTAALFKEQHYPPLEPKLPFSSLDIERQPKTGRYQK